jgi:hypothetical protein
MDSDKEKKNLMSRTFDYGDVRKSIRRINLSETRSPEDVQDDSKSEYIKIFKSACNRFQKAQAGTLYQKLTKSHKFYQDANDFFKIFHLKLKSELVLSEFLEIIENNKKNQAIVQTQSILEKILKKPLMLISNNENIAPPLFLKKMFERYDRNHDGFVNLYELNVG